MHSRFVSLSRRFLMSGAALFALTSYAQAQEAGNGTTETVVVTGTRIPRPESDLPIPVTTIGSQEIAHSGTTDLGDYLKRIPALTGSLGNNENSGYNTGASDDGASLGGLNLLDLRNLGYVRTLVLIDGHRTVSESTGSAAVDINTIPITLIDRVEVVTGGASAIYGADGVSGVVNFVMKHDLDGVKFRAQVGTSNDGGGSSTISAISAGHNFDDDKGNVTFTFESGYQDRLFFTQRPYTRVGGESFFVTNPNDRHDNPNKPDNIPKKDVQFTYSAVTGAIDLNFDFVPDRLGNGDGYHLGNTNIGNSSALYSSGMPYANDLQGDFQPLERRYVTQANGHYDFSRYFKLSANLSYANIFTKSYNIAPFDDFTMITSQNAFLPSNLASSIAAHGGFAALSEDYLPMRMAEVVKRATYRSVLDASGDIPEPSFLDNLKYDVSYVYGQSNIDDAQDNNRLEDRFAAALDSVIDPKTGQATCRSNLNPSAKPPDLSIFDSHAGQTIFGPVFSDIQTIGPADWPNNLTFTPGPNSGCVPYNPFNPAYNNNKAIAWATATTHTMGVIMQNVVSGDVTAEVPAFKDWGFAGPLSVVGGGEYRKESSQSTPDAYTQGLDAFDGGINPVAGSFDVSEEFAEMSLPVVKDWLFIKEFTLDGAVRHSEYSTAGESTSWQYSGVLSPFDGLKLRGSQAYAVRAPNIGELFAPVQNLFSAIADPCDKSQVNNGTQFRLANCQAIFKGLGVPYNPSTAVLSNGVTTPTSVGGNINLKAEAARTYTAGAVIEPPGSGLTLTLDWYNVSIANAIEALPAETIADECVDLSTIVNSFCSSVTRGASAHPAGLITLVKAQEINVAQFGTSGLDITANYHLDTADYLGDNYGAFDFHLIGNYLDTITRQALPDQAHEEHADEVGSSDSGGIDGGSTPRWQFNLDTVWSFEKWTVDFNWDWYDGVLLFNRQTTADQPDIVAPQYLHLPARDVFDLQVGYDFAQGWNGYAGVNNVFYQKPAIGENTAPVDPLGRFFYVGVKADLDWGQF